MRRPTSSPILFQLVDLRDAVDKDNGECVGDEDRRHRLKEDYGSAHLLHHRLVPPAKHRLGRKRPWSLLSLRVNLEMLAPHLDRLMLCLPACLRAGSASVHGFAAKAHWHIDIALLPPLPRLTGRVDVIVVDGAERNSELTAHLERDTSRLSVANVVSVAR